MKKYDWSEERKKSLPLEKIPEAVLSEPVRDEVPEQKQVEPEKKKTGRFKGKFSKIAILTGRIIFFVCPAFSVTNTLLQYWRPNPVAATAVKVEAKSIPIPVEKIKMTVPVESVKQLNMAFSAIIQEKKSDPLHADLATVNGVGKNDVELLIDVNQLKNNNFRIKSKEELHRFLKREEDIRVTESTFSVDKAYYDVDNVSPVPGRADSKVKSKVYHVIQYIAGIKVFASAAFVYTDQDGNVRYIKCKFSRTSKKQLQVKAQLMPKSLQQQIQKAETAKVTQTESVIFDPALVLQKGKVCIAWKIILKLANNKKICLIIDQTNRKVVFKYDMKPSES